MYTNIIFVSLKFSNWVFYEITIVFHIVYRNMKMVLINCLYINTPRSPVDGEVWAAVEHRVVIEQLVASCGWAASYYWVSFCWTMSCRWEARVCAADSKQKLVAYNQYKSSNDELQESSWSIVQRDALPIV